MKGNKGFTLVELLVSMSLFGIVGLGLVAFTSNALRGLSDESRLSFAALEAKNALGMLSSELRMSSAISPYLPGTDSSATNCRAAVSANATTLRFMLAEDDSDAATAGIQPYYVGYRFDSISGTLLRGEIPGSTVTSCVVPAGDPASSAVAQTLAERVVQIDADGDGTLEPVFSLSGDVLTVNLGVQLITQSGEETTQHFVTKIYLRTNA